MDAGKFWNLAKTNTKESDSDFFAKRDTSKNPLENVSFSTMNNAKTQDSGGGGGWNLAKTNSKDEVAPVTKTTDINFASATTATKTDSDAISLDVTVTQASSESNKENEQKSDEEVKDEEYCSQLVALNKSVLEWIKKHVNKNPCIDLSPVIHDYEKHLGSLEDQFKSRMAAKKLLTTPEPSHTSPATSSSNKLVSFVSSTPISGGDSGAPSKFPPAGFFSQPPPSLSVKPQEAAAAAPEAASAAAGDEDAPPVVERKTIVEDDAFYQTRSKLFFKKGASWQELGVGMLYLKPCGDKIQMLIRMEAVTGKVLLNINVSTDMPISRSGKNNVMVVSVPNPPVYLKPADGDNSVPCTYLVRVKDGKEADELFAKLKKTE